LPPHRTRTCSTNSGKYQSPTEREPRGEHRHNSRMPYCAGIQGFLMVMYNLSNLGGSSRRAPHGTNPSQNRTGRFPASGSSSNHLQNGTNTWSFFEQVYVDFRSRQGVLLHKQNKFIPGVAPSLASPIQVLKQMLFYLVKEVTKHFPVIRHSVILVVSP